MRDFEPHEPLSNSGKRQLAKSIIGKHDTHDDLHEPGPVVGTSGGKLKRLHVDVADNGYSVHHSVEHEQKEGDESTHQPEDHTHVFEAHEKASEHIGNLLRGHHEGRRK